MKIEKSYLEYLNSNHPDLLINGVQSLADTLVFNLMSLADESDSYKSDFIGMYNKHYDFKDGEKKIAHEIDIEDCEIRMSRMWKISYIDPVMDAIDIIGNFKLKDFFMEKLEKSYKVTLIYA